MDLSQNRQSSLFLLLGTFLMFVTMILHPVGGDVEHLLKVSQMGMIAHGLAIFSLPFSALGFIGLSRQLGINRFFSKLGLAFMLLALAAAMLAATANGFILPMFIGDYAGADPATLDSIHPILRYNIAFNHAFDYQLITGMFLSMFLWSISIVQTGNLPRWIAYLGFVIVAVILGTVLSGFSFLDLGGFRMFVFGWLIWIVAVGIVLWRVGDDRS